MKKLLSLALVFGMLLVPVSQAKAVSLSDVMTQLTSLKAEVAQIKSSIAPKGKVLGEETVSVIIRTLAPGLKSDSEVMKLQAFLNSYGYLAVTPDGNYGPQTTEGVKRFQAANKLTATGTVDYQTMTAINQIVANTPPVIVQPGSVDVDTFFKNLPAQIALYQAMLKDPAKYKAEAVKFAPTASEDKAAHPPVGTLTCTGTGGWNGTGLVYMWVENPVPHWQFMSWITCEL